MVERACMPTRAKLENKGGARDAEGGRKGRFSPLTLKTSVLRDKNKKRCKERDIVLDVQKRRG